MNTPWYPIDALDSLEAAEPIAFAEKLAYLIYRFHDLEQTECPLEHEFVDGKYIRRIRIPKGTLFIGRPHKLSHLIQLDRGAVIHVTERCRRLINAPFSMTSTPGYQVAALALTDIEARTVHPDFGERDIEVLEPMLFEPLDSVLALGKRVANRIQSDPVSSSLTHRSELICQL
jgi:hypothetical protein